MSVFHLPVNLESSSQGAVSMLTTGNILEQQGHSILAPATSVHHNLSVTKVIAELNGHLRAMDLWPPNRRKPLTGLGDCQTLSQTFINFYLPVSLMNDFSRDIS